MAPLRRPQRPDAEPERGGGRPTADTAAPLAKRGAAPSPARATGRVGSRSMAKGRVGSRSMTKGQGAPSRGRYTPPQPKAQAPSPRWLPVLMFGLWALAILVIVLNYLELMPHFPGSNQAGGTDNYWLLTGLALALGGFVVATRWR